MPITTPPQAKLPDEYPLLSIEQDIKLLAETEAGTRYASLDDLFDLMYQRYMDQRWIGSMSYFSTAPDTSQGDVWVPLNGLPISKAERPKLYARWSAQNATWKTNQGWTEDSTTFSITSYTSYFLRTRMNAVADAGTVEQDMGRASTLIIDADTGPLTVDGNGGDLAIINKQDDLGVGATGGFSVYDRPTPGVNYGSSGSVGDARPGTDAIRLNVTLDTAADWLAYKGSEFRPKSRAALLYVYAGLKVTI